MSTTQNRVQIRPEAAAPADAYNKVLGKLVFFTLMMVLAPISTYYLSLSHVFDGKNTTAAAISAAIVANLVLAAFVVVALLEDKQDHDKQKKQ